MTKNEWRIFWQIFFNTYDNGSKELALKDLVELTEGSRRNTIKNIGKLRKRKIIIRVVKGDYHGGNVYSINKNVDEWESE